MARLDNAMDTQPVSIEALRFPTKKGGRETQFQVICRVPGVRETQSCLVCREARAVTLDLLLFLRK